MRNKPLQSVARVLKYRKHASTMIGTPFAALGWWSSAKARLGRHVEQAAEVCSVNARLLFDRLYLLIRGRYSVFRRLILGAMSSANSVVLCLVGRVIIGAMHIGAMHIGANTGISSSTSVITSFLDASVKSCDIAFHEATRMHHQDLYSSFS